MRRKASTERTREDKNSKRDNIKRRKKLKKENWKRNIEPMKGKLKEKERPSLDKADI